MASIVTEVNPLDLDKIIDHFAALPRPLPAQLVESDPDQADFQAGKLLFEKGRSGVAACSSCHNAVHPTAPLLQAQHAGYIRKQLNDFKRGDRASERSAMMNVIAQQLTEDEINTLAIYLQASGRYEADITH
jgi:cytochrome c553